ncbi:MAG: hypothetical protein IPO66_10505 [Rhodanobacteraceae bacterium]|nr:hypothetical protein [Rhodanobacteraceae bacterium]
MFAQSLMVLSAAIVFTLGTLHLLYTFRGPKLTPRDPALRAQMEQVSPVITRQTTMWRAWIGFNATHSMGAMLFGLIYGYLAIAHAALLFQSAYLLTVGLVMLGALLVVARLYFFRIPLIGVSIALACYVASVVAKSL